MVERLLPNTFIAGCMRSGTTMLFECLKKHPQVITSVLKETNYWDIRCEDGVPLSDYSQLFPDTRFITDRHRVILDASPGYSYHPEAFNRIRDVLGPSPKIILLLRNPTKRTISHFQWLRYYGFISDTDLERFKDVEGFYYHNIIDRSIYPDQVYRAYKNFDNVKVILFEDFMRNTSKVLDELADFLWIDRFSDFKDYIDFSFPKYSERNDLHKIELSEEDVDYLRDTFQDSIEELEEMLNIQTGWL